LLEELLGLQAQALQRKPFSSVDAYVEVGERATMNAKSMLIGALIVAVGVLGYLYWDSQRNTVLKVPGVTIKKN
jgi:hypothetical protein